MPVAVMTELPEMDDLWFRRILAKLHSCLGKSAGTFLPVAFLARRDAVSPRGGSSSGAGRDMVDRDASPVQRNSAVLTLPIVSVEQDPLLESWGCVFPVDPLKKSQSRRHLKAPSR